MFNIYYKTYMWQLWNLHMLHVAHWAWFLVFFIDGGMHDFHRQWCPFQYTEWTHHTKHYASETYSYINKSRWYLTEGYNNLIYKWHYIVEIITRKKIIRRRLDISGEYYKRNIHSVYVGIQISWSLWQWQFTLIKET